MTPKPTARINPMHATMLASMIASESGTRSHKIAVDGDILNVQIPLASAPRWPLARNISELSIERTAKRWAPV